MITAEGILATACLDSCVILDENLHIQQGPKKRYASNRNEKKNTVTLETLTIAPG